LIDLLKKEVGECCIRGAKGTEVNAEGNRSEAVCRNTAPAALSSLAHSMKLHPGSLRAMLSYAGDIGEAGNGYTAPFAATVTDKT